MNIVDEIYEYWFGPMQTVEQRIFQLNQKWFQGNQQIDIEITQKFKSYVIKAEHGKLNSWQDAPKDCLALILLLDQFSLNIFREQKRAFNNSLIASKMAQKALLKKFDQQVSPIERVFYYLPLEHTEDIQIQIQSVDLFQKLLQDVPETMKQTYKNYLDYAMKHYEVIKQFGHFPGRNQAMNRIPSEDEINYLHKYGGF